MVRHRQQQIGQPQDISDQQKRNVSHDMAQGRPDKAQEGRDKGGHEGVPRGGNGQQPSQGRDERQNVEIVRRQRRGERQRTQRSGQISGHKGDHPLEGTAFAAIPAGEGLIQAARQQHHTQCGGKAELQAHAAHGIGIGQQDHRQSGGQTGQRVAAPPEQRREQQEYLHDAGPDHRG